MSSATMSVNRTAVMNVLCVIIWAPAKHSVSLPRRVSRHVLWHRETLLAHCSVC